MNESKLQELTTMDWGSFTPEFSREKELVHVFNHFIETSEAAERTIRFIIGRIQWSNAYFHTPFVHTVVIDDVGQNISKETREHMRKSLEEYVVSLRFQSEEK